MTSSANLPSAAPPPSSSSRSRQSGRHPHQRRRRRRRPPSPSTLSSPPSWSSPPTTMTPAPSLLGTIVFAAAAICLFLARAAPTAAWSPPSSLSGMRRRLLPLGWNARDIVRSVLQYEDLLQTHREPGSRLFFHHRSDEEEREGEAEGGDGNLLRRRRRRRSSALGMTGSEDDDAREESNQQSQDKEEEQSEEELQEIISALLGNEGANKKNTNPDDNDPKSSSSDAYFNLAQKAWKAASEASGQVIGSVGKFIDESKKKQRELQERTLERTQQPQLQQPQPEQLTDVESETPMPMPMPMQPTFDFSQDPIQYPMMGSEMGWVSYDNDGNGNGNTEEWANVNSNNNNNYNYENSDFDMNLVEEAVGYFSMMMAANTNPSGETNTDVDMGMGADMISDTGRSRDDGDGVAGVVNGAATVAPSDATESLTPLAAGVADGDGGRIGLGVGVGVSMAGAAVAGTGSGITATGSVDGGNGKGIIVGKTGDPSLLRKIQSVPKQKLTGKDVGPNSFLSLKTKKSMTSAMNPTRNEGVGFGVGKKLGVVKGTEASFPTGLNKVSKGVDSKDFGSKSTAAFPTGLNKLDKGSAPDDGKTREQAKTPSIPSTGITGVGVNSFDKEASFPTGLNKLSKGVDPKSVVAKSASFPIGSNKIPVEGSALNDGKMPGIGKVSSVPTPGNNGVGGEVFGAMKGKEASFPTGLNKLSKGTDSKSVVAKTAGFPVGLNKVVKGSTFGKEKILGGIEASSIPSIGLENPPKDTGGDDKADEINSFPPNGLNKISKGAVSTPIGKTGGIKTPFPSGINKFSKGSMDGKMNVEAKRTTIPTGLKDLSKYQDDKLSGGAKIQSFPVKKLSKDLDGKMSDQAKLSNFPKGLKTLSKDQNGKTTTVQNNPLFPTGLNTSPKVAAKKVFEIKSPTFPQGLDRGGGGVQSSSLRDGFGQLFVGGEKKKGVKDFLPAGFDKRSGMSKIENKNTQSASVGLNEISLNIDYTSDSGEESNSNPSALNPFPKGSSVGSGQDKTSSVNAGIKKTGGDAFRKGGAGLDPLSFPSGLNKLSKGTAYSKDGVPDYVTGNIAGIPKFPKIKEFAKSKLTGKDNGPNTFPPLKKFSKDALSKSPIKVGIDASKAAVASKSLIPTTTIKAPKEAADSSYSDDKASKSQYVNGLKTPSFPTGLNKLSKGADPIKADSAKASVVGKVAGESFLQKIKDTPKPKLTGKEAGPNSFLSLKKSPGDSLGKAPIKVGIGSSKSPAFFKSPTNDTPMSKDGNESSSEIEPAGIAKSPSFPSSLNKTPKGTVEPSSSDSGDKESKTTEIVVGLKTAAFPTGLNKLSKGAAPIKADGAKASVVGKVAGESFLQKIKDTPKQKLTGKEAGPNSFLSLKKSPGDSLGKAPIKVGIGSSKSPAFFKSPTNDTPMSKDGNESSSEIEPADITKSPSFPSSLNETPKGTVEPSSSDSGDKASKTTEIVVGLKTAAFPSGLNKLSKGAAPIKGDSAKASVVGKVAGESFLQKIKDTPKQKLTGKEAGPNSFLSLKKSLSKASMKVGIGASKSQAFLKSPKTDTPLSREGDVLISKKVPSKSSLADIKKSPSIPPSLIKSLKGGTDSADTDNAAVKSESLVGVKIPSFPNDKSSKGDVFTKDDDSKNLVVKIAADSMVQKIKDTSKPKFTGKEMGSISFLPLKNSSRDPDLKRAGSISPNSSSFETTLKGEVRVGLGIGKSTVDPTAPFPSPPMKGSVVGKSPYLSNIKKLPKESEKSSGMDGNDIKNKSDSALSFEKTSSKIAVDGAGLSVPKTTTKGSKGPFSKEAGMKAAFGLEKSSYTPNVKKAPNAVGTSDGADSKTPTSGVPGMNDSSGMEDANKIVGLQAKGAKRSAKSSDRESKDTFVGGLGKSTVDSSVFPPAPKKGSTDRSSSPYLANIAKSTNDKTSSPTSSTTAPKSTIVMKGSTSVDDKKTDASSFYSKKVFVKSDASGEVKGSWAMDSKSKKPVPAFSLSDLKKSLQNSSTGAAGDENGISPAPEGGSFTSDDDVFVEKSSSPKSPRITVSHATSVRVEKSFQYPKGSSVHDGPPKSSSTGLRITDAEITAVDKKEPIIRSDSRKPLEEPLSKDSYSSRDVVSRKADSTSQGDVPAGNDANQEVDRVTKFDPTALGKGQSFFGTVSSRVYGVGGERPPFFAEPKSKVGQQRVSVTGQSGGQPPLSKLSSLASGPTPDFSNENSTKAALEKELQTIREGEKQRDAWLQEQNRLIQERQETRTARTSNSSSNDTISNLRSQDMDSEKSVPEIEYELEKMRQAEAQRELWITEENKLIEERRKARMAEEQKIKEQREKLLAAMKAKKSVEEEKLREEMRLAEESRAALEVEMRLMEEAKLANQINIEEELRRAELKHIAEEKKIKDEIRRVEAEKLAKEKQLQEEILAEQKRLEEVRRLAEESRRAEEAQAEALKAANDRHLKDLEEKLEKMRNERILEEKKLEEAREATNLAKLKEESRVATEKIEAERQLKALKKQLELKNEAEKKLESIRAKTLEKKKEEQQIWKDRQRELAEKIELENRLTEDAIAAAKRAEAELKALEEKERKEILEREAVEKQLNEVRSRIAEQKKREEETWIARQKELAEKIAEENRLTQEAIAAAEKAEAELQLILEEQERMDAEDLDEVFEKSQHETQRNTKENAANSSPSSVDIMSSIHNIAPIHSVVAAAPIPESEQVTSRDTSEQTALASEPEIPKYETFSRGAKLPASIDNSNDDNLDSSSPLATDIEALELVSLCQASFDPNRPTLDSISPTATADSYTKYFHQYDSDDLSTPEDDMCLVPSEYPFVSLLRDSSPYIVNHRQSTIVYHIPGDLISDQKKFNSVMDDIALTWLFGMKIVICVGCRKQVIDRLERMHLDSIEGSTVDGVALPGVRVTTPDTLRVLEEEAGFCRFEVERQLNRCLRNKGADCNVVSGCFVTAKKFGVVDGIDYQFTGYPKTLHKDKIHRFHARNDVVLLTPLGFTKHGDALNIHSEALAAFTAGALEASKIVYFSNNGMVMRGRSKGEGTEDSIQRVQMIRRSNAKQILSHYGLTVDSDTGFPRWNKPAFVDRENSEQSIKKLKEQQSWLLKVGWATHALDRGVERAHIVTCDDGALLEELFTARRGYGTCISQDDFMSPHPEDWNDDLSVSAALDEF